MEENVDKETLKIKNQAISNIENEKERKNWLIHYLYVRHDFDECIRIVEEQLRLCHGLCEYAIYIKALILRQRGRIDESYRLFQAATMLNPTNPENLKQVGRSLHLLGKQREAVQLFNEAQKYAPTDWEIWHNKGLCMVHVKQYEGAEECFLRANGIQKHDVTFLQLGRVYTLQNKFVEAIDTYTEALEYSRQNPEILTTLGILYLRINDPNKAFDYLGASAARDPTNARTILANGSIIQDHQEMDAALLKYRIAAVKTPNSAQLWNNIGMCHFGNRKYFNAAVCLKRSLYLAPFEWIVAFNLGLVYLYTEQYASAFHYFSAAINLNPDFPSSYMYLGIALSRLDDFKNSSTSYEKAIEMDPHDHVFSLNYAITLYNFNHIDASKLQFKRYKHLFSQMNEDEQRNSDENLKGASVELEKALKRS